MNKIENMLLETCKEGNIDIFIRLISENVDIETSDEVIIFYENYYDLFLLL